MVSNDDFDGKATHLNCFYLHINFEQKYPKPAIVICSPQEGVERGAPLPVDFRVIVYPTPLQMNDFCDLLGTPDAPVSIL